MGIVLRGGSFGDKAIAVRSSARFRYDEDVRYYANGFRVARELGLMLGASAWKYSFFSLGAARGLP